MNNARISGRKILLARKRRLMTQTGLSEQAAIPQTLVSRMENSISTDVTAEQLVRIAHALDFPESWFVPDGADNYKQPLSLHSPAFRKAASPSQKKIDFAVALANHYVLLVQQLLDAVELEPQFKLPAFEIVGEDRGGIVEDAASVCSPEEAAKRVRELWQIPRGPMENLCALIEASGVIVVHADFSDVDVDGVTIRPTAIRPIIFLNRNRPACRQRFSLAHELGHVVLHGYHTRDMEKEADRFAAELLLPAKSVEADLRRPLSIPRLGQLKKKWRASMAAILYRAQSLDCISSYKARQLWIQMAKAGYKTQEPDDFSIDRENPTTFRNLIDLHTQELGYSYAELASSLDTHTAEFLEMAGIQTEGVRPRKIGKLKVVVDNAKYA